MRADSDENSCGDNDDNGDNGDGEVDSGGDEVDGEVCGGGVDGGRAVSMASSMPRAPFQSPVAMSASNRSETPSCEDDWRVCESECV